LKNLCICIFLLTTFTLFSQTDFSTRVDLGEIEHSELAEASGLVESSFNEHVLWSHNDTYNYNRIFAFDVQGRHLGIFWLDGVENRDWEDLALGPGPDEGIDYLYLGEIGDNDSVHEFKYVYRIPEPEVQFDQEPVEETIYEYDTIIYQYPDGNRDSETLMVDPLTKDIYIVSKREFEDIRVYRAPYPQPLDEVIILEHVASIALTQIVGGDISGNGSEILLKNYHEVYYWERDSAGDLWNAFNNDPILLPYVMETQGEAICWAADSKGYYTLSEEGMWISAHLYYYPRLDPSPVVINEIMPDPESVPDEAGEWFEIYNNSDEAIDLYGWYLQDGSTDSHIISESINLYPGEYLVLGNNDNESSNGGVTVDYEYFDFDLDNSEDVIMIFTSENSLVDSIAYNDVFFPVTNGRSIALLNANMENGCSFSWRQSSATYGDGDIGTPGQDNSGMIPDLKIKDIQYTEDPSGHSEYVGQKVTVHGTLSIDPFGFSNNNFFIQDSLGMWSGIMIHYQGSVSDQDSVSLTGTVAEGYDDLTILIEIEEIELLGSGNVIIDPITVNTGEISTGSENCEAYESVLVKVSGVCEDEGLGWREVPLLNYMNCDRLKSTEQISQ